MDTKVQLVHFSHHHPLNLVQLHLNQEEEEDEEEEVEDFVVEDHHVGQCNMCKEGIYSFHLCYYNCKKCGYSLHKFCAEIPEVLQGHPLHPNHKLTLSEKFQDPNFSSDQIWTCGVCNSKRQNLYNYHCSICKFNMDITCATISQQKIDHPSHLHQLQRNSNKSVSCCNACGREHDGTFYHCTTCYGFCIHQDCASMPTKLLIQQPTDDNFTHPHPLILTYSFPDIDQKAKFYPRCRICDTGFYIYFWIYKCDKCRYYVHIHCATSNYFQFLSPGRGKIRKNFKDEDHPNLLHCPFPDESYNLLKHHFIISNEDFAVVENHGKYIEHPRRHRHPLILLDTQTSLEKNSILLHNPLRKIQLLCDGCVKPITEMPFYKCSDNSEEDCEFVLHYWCARLPLEIRGHPRHPQHELLLMPKAISLVYGVFWCDICMLPSNGFGYICMDCEHKVDVNCAFLPEEITHEAHPNHLLSRIDDASSGLSITPCNACGNYLINCTAFHCSSCNFYLDTECAFMLPKMITHKYDKHPLSLRYAPIENHPSDYFCEICEDEFNPGGSWFYHCGASCVQSMHTACAPVIFQCEQAVYAYYKRCVFQFVNVKFGGVFLIQRKGEHEHRFITFAQGIDCHARCHLCGEKLQYKMIFRCLDCKYGIHYECVHSYSDLRLSSRHRYSYTALDEKYFVGASLLRERPKTKMIKKEENRQIKKHTYYALP